MPTLLATRPQSVTSTKKELNQRVLDTLKSNGGKYFNVNNTSKQLLKASHVGRFKKDGKEHIVLLRDDATFSINPMNIGENGIPYLSRFNIGGTVFKRDNLTLQEMVDKYNKDSKDSIHDRGIIEEVITL